MKIKCILINYYDQERIFCDSEDLDKIVNKFEIVLNGYHDFRDFYWIAGMLNDKHKIAGFKRKDFEWCEVYIAENAKINYLDVKEHGVNSRTIKVEVVGGLDG